MTSGAPTFSEAEYAEIEAAVMETMRGRWFLGEYARRNRHADTLVVLAELKRLAAAVRGEDTGVSKDAPSHIRVEDIFEMADDITRAKSEIAAIADSAATFAAGQNQSGAAAIESNPAAQKAEDATWDILAAAEHIQEIAWTLRERGIDDQICDSLDRRATDIYAACAVQNPDGEAIRRALQTLETIEARVNAMVADARQASAVYPDFIAPAADAGPAEHMPISEDDPLLATFEGETWSNESLSESDLGSPTDIAADNIDWPELQSASPIFLPDAAELEEEMALVEEDERKPAELLPARSVMASLGSTKNDPLAAISALSHEEKIALFS